MSLKNSKKVEKSNLVHWSKLDQSRQEGSSMDTQLVATQMRHRSWMEDYARQQESDLTVRQWCRENGILPKTFYYRLRVLREEACSLMNLEPNKCNTQSISRRRL